MFMTEQDQYLACAELDGYIREQAKSLFDPRLDVTYWYRDSIRTACCPDYSTRDAIIGVIEKQNGPIGNTFEYRFVQCLLESIPGMETRGVSHLSFPEVYFLIRATPAQLREALLRATGKWKES